MVGSKGSGKEQREAEAGDGGDVRGLTFVLPGPCSDRSGHEMMDYLELARRNSNLRYQCPRVANNISRAGAIKQNREDKVGAIFDRHTAQEKNLEALRKKQGRKDDHGGEASKVSRVRSNACSPTES